MKLVRYAYAASALLFLAMIVPLHAQAPAAQPGTTILHPANLVKVLPGSVFFCGQSATTQLRNSGGVKFADGALMMTALVNNSGYSSGIQQKYQAYLITEVPLDVEGHRLAPGAYGAGILRSGAHPQFVVQDLGAHDLLQAPARHDAGLHRPMPLQVMATGEAGAYRLYLGRDFVEFRRGK
jgi:hypothetical protein